MVRAACKLPFVAAAFSSVLAAASVVAAEPVPRASVPSREMSTDRPDSTESPYTVEPGRAQVEMSFATRERDRRDGARSTTWEAAPFNVRVGMTRSTEVGFFYVPYQRVTEQSADGDRTITEGGGDFTARGKWNLRGNDDSGPAVGVIVDLTLPTAPRRFGPRRIEVAATLPVAFDLGGGWNAGGMTSVQSARDEEGSRRPLYFNTITAGRELAANFGAFAEFASTSGHGAHVLTFNCGVTRELNADFQLDAGVNLGISDAAPDTLWFAGMSRRF